MDNWTGSDRRLSRPRSETEPLRSPQTAKEVKSFMHAKLLERNLLISSLEEAYCNLTMNTSILWFPFESVPKVFSQSETQASHCPSWDTVRWRSANRSWDRFPW